MFKNILKKIDCIRVASIVNSAVKKNTNYKKNVVNKNDVLFLINKISEKRYKHDILIQISIFLNKISNSIDESAGINLFTMYCNVKGLRNDLKNSIYKILRKYKQKDI